jgi:hypothetical protein
MNESMPSDEEVERGKLDKETADLLDAHAGNPEGLRTVLFGSCWPNTTNLPNGLPKAGDLRVEVREGETVQDAVLRLGHAWSAQWLFDAGHRVIDAGGAALAADDPCTTTGPVRWDPEVRVPRVDDQVGERSPEDSQKRRLAGEIATAALWRRAAIKQGIGNEGAEDIRPENLPGGTRGSRFKNALLYVLRREMPRSWQVKAEIPLEQIYGLHLRRDVGTRRSDIVVFDERERLVVVVSSKWTWRSDRGTEAAQMVPLRRYRPDVPYLLVTAEFPRLRGIGRESVEDRVYSVCPTWAAAFLVLRELENPASGPIDFPRLADLETEAERLVDILELKDVAGLVDDLRNSGRLG